MENIKLKNMLKEISSYWAPANLLLIMLEENKFDENMLDKIYITIANAIKNTKDIELREKLQNTNDYISQLRKKELEDKYDENIDDLLIKI